MESREKCGLSTDEEINSFHDMNGVNNAIFSEKDESGTSESSICQKTHYFKRINISPLVRKRLSKIVELTEEDSMISQTLRIRNNCKENTV